MKTSKKILIILGSFIILSFLTGLMLFRNEVFSLIEAKAILSYKEIPVQAVEQVCVSENWDVKIRHGRNFKLELEDDELQYLIELEGEALCLTMDSITQARITKPVRARITAPAILEIKGVNGAHIDISNFTADSMRIFLDEGCLFTAKNNSIKYLDFETKGNNQLKIIETL